MPLYLVRWPSLAASLVRAENENELLAILDEAADPGGCTYEIYRGPVWIDFDVPFEVRDCSPEGIVPTDPSDFVVERPSPARHLTGPSLRCAAHSLRGPRAGG
jgi:hypothetical protein